MRIVHAEVVDADIDLADVVRRVSGPGCGGVATFTGLVLDLLATGQRKRLTEALECALGRLDALTRSAP